MKKYYFFLLLAFLAVCAGLFYLVKHNPTSSIGAAGKPPPMPQFKYVALVVEENHSYEDTIGNPQMPYFNYLANTYGLATQYYANQHKSLGDYFWLTAGQRVSDVATETGYSVDNIFGRVTGAGMTWKAYEQSLPEAGFLWEEYGWYVRWHDPAAYYTNTTSSAEKDNIVPADQLQHDIASDTLPNFMFITPDADDDAHDGTLAEADDWLKNNIAPLVADQNFMQHGLLIITFDEGDLRTDNRHGGGRIATLVIGDDVKPGYKSMAFYQHQNTLKTICDAFGFSTCPGAANTAQGMEEFLK